MSRNQTKRDTSRRPFPKAVDVIHLDALGGVAGDMFAAALLDACPELWPEVEAQLAAMSLGSGHRICPLPHTDGVLTGARFIVEAEHPDASREHSHDGKVNGACRGSHGHGHHAHGDHSHNSWRDIRRSLEQSPLNADVRDVAIAIFELLAEAEAKVHGVATEDVSFHEVGNLDSIADILAAATLVTALSPCRWTIGQLPRGRGLARTAHGYLPVPTPATMELLTGFVLFDDGETGERVTPTGAAILKFLNPSQDADPAALTLLGSGAGFGTRKLDRRSNILRACLYQNAETQVQADRVTVLRCEIDDQTGEDLATAIEHIRAEDGVIDVCQWPVFGKKGRMAAAVQVLAEPERADAICDAILDETTTLGVRRQILGRRLVAREMLDVDGTPVKMANRPSGPSAKAEADHLHDIRGVSNRQRQRLLAESNARAAGATQ
ncbi:hypothetical protein CLV78_111128 [Aliiruegeria haliotis]|uniref:LarC family nickel insertion protein n=1 Tax=Aliiruegeria haliotis TaxID=1280846 RepID=A0A2T0RIG1_9RHOB|nr:LarC family nickel insertion protein [Aliiruegeria haliotis]PRY20973.1 hypothetical protein CLV78_111128 [Aliiruegeria haliotis]